MSRSRPSIPLRLQLALLFTLLSLGATALFGVLTYSVSRQALEDNAVRAVQLAAEERLEALRRRLLLRQHRARALLAAGEAGCAAAGGARESGCRRALALLRATEGFDAALLEVPGDSVQVGDARALAQEPAFAPGQFARFARGPAGDPYYLVRVIAPEGGQVLTMRFDDLSQIEELFGERAGLGESGETFLADQHGLFITSPRFPAGKAGRSHPIEARPMRLCLSGQAGMMLAEDYARRDVIHGFRPVPFIGGGCIMAHTVQHEAFAPARRLGRQVVAVGAVLSLLSFAASLVVARGVSRPVVRLSDAARSLAEGGGEIRVPETGTREVRELAIAFNAMQQAIGERTRDLEEANRAKSDFLAAMSHELRTPLNAISGYAELLDLGIYGKVNPEQREAIRRITRSQAHLLGLINEVLNYAKLEAGRVQFRLEELGVEEVLSEVGALIEPQLRARQLRFSWSACDPAVRLVADREKLQQVLLNLLSNAVKFTQPGGAVRMECDTSAERVAIRVIDTGIGVPADKLEAIFEPFVQVGTELTSRSAGTGLGLAISRDLVVGMGGHLGVDSAPGRGSTFTVTLPRGSGQPHPVA